MAFAILARPSVRATLGLLTATSTYLCLWHAVKGDAPTTAKVVALPPPSLVPPVTDAAPEPEPDQDVSVIVEEPASPRQLDDVWLLARSNGRAYLWLQEVEREAPLPEHTTGEGWARGYHHHWSAPLTPEAAQPWQALVGQRVVTESGCRATIKGIEILSRLVANEEWGTVSARDTRELGARAVVARLSGCGGESSTYARRVDTHAIAGIPAHAPAAKAAARAKLLGSPQARAAMERYDGPTPTAWRDEARWDVRALRHPVTRATWIVAHAGPPLDGGCDVFNTHLLALDRVDASGDLVEEKIVPFDSGTALLAVIDADRDGRFELVVESPADGVISFVAAERFSHSEVNPGYVGCPC